MLTNVTGGDVGKASWARRRLLLAEMRRDERLTLADQSELLPGESRLELDDGTILVGPCDVLTSYAERWQALGGAAEC